MARRRALANRVSAHGASAISHEAIGIYQGKNDASPAYLTKLRESDDGRRDCSGRWHLDGPPELRGGRHRVTAARWDEVRAPSTPARHQMSSAWKATKTAIMMRISPKPPSSLMWAK